MVERVEGEGAALGTTRDQAIEDSVRRSLAAAALSELLGVVRERAHGGLPEEEATDLAYSDVRGASTESTGSPHDAPPQSR